MIKLENISKSFGDTKVLENFTYQFEKGEKYYINGVSGKGKTTLLRILMKLETIDSGEVLGLENAKISVVFQENRLVENISALRNISFATQKSDDEIMQKLKDFGLEGFEKCAVSTLSGGMKRRVAILRGMLLKHDVLLLDEPFRGLDDAIKDIVIEQINKLESTVIFTTHTKNEVKKLDIKHQIDL